LRHCHELESIHQISHWIPLKPTRSIRFCIPMISLFIGPVLQAHFFVLLPTSRWCRFAGRPSDRPKKTEGPNTVAPRYINIPVKKYMHVYIVHMYVYNCIYICICVCSVYAYVYPYMSICVYVHMCICVYLDMSLCVCVYMYTVYVYLIYVYMCMCKMCICVYVYLCMCVICVYV
jgi:hypothetical protein